MASFKKYKTAKGERWLLNITLTDPSQERKNERLEEDF